MEVRYPPPPGKQKSYLSDTCAIPHENKAKWVRYPLCNTISKGHRAIWGVSRSVGAFLQHFVGILPHCLSLVSISHIAQEGLNRSKNSAGCSILLEVGYSRGVFDTTPSMNLKIKQQHAYATVHYHSDQNFADRVKILGLFRDVGTPRHKTDTCRKKILGN